MPRRQRPKGTRTKPKKTPTSSFSVPWKSGLEEQVGEQIREVEGEVSFETAKIPYTIPARGATYTPDFFLKNGVIVETKGELDRDDRKKHLLIKEQHPHLDIRFVFAHPNNRIYKGSPTTYAAWAEEHGFRWAEKFIPEEWFNER